MTDPREVRQLRATSAEVQALLKRADAREEWLGVIQRLEEDRQSVLNLLIDVSRQGAPGELLTELSHACQAAGALLAQARLAHRG